MLICRIYFHRWLKGYATVYAHDKPGEVFLGACSISEVFFRARSLVCGSQLVVYLPAGMQTNIFWVGRLAQCYVS